MRKFISLSLLIVFIVLRTSVDIYQINISETVLYALEVFYVSVVYFIYRKEVRIISALRKKDGITSLLFCVFGFFVFKASSILGISIPLDLRSSETIFLLLIVAPLLEEFIYRLAFWKSLEEISSNKVFLVLITSLLFSIGHFTAYFFVPAEFKPFIVYQTVYVFWLALLLGTIRASTQAISTPVLFHFLFNLGFLLGSL
jgi:membrane protease YdiL (CAAX protease family)